jgi:hypothetical protein
MSGDPAHASIPAIFQTLPVLVFDDQRRNHAEHAVPGFGVGEDVAVDFSLGWNADGF